MTLATFLSRRLPALLLVIVAAFTQSSFAAGASFTPGARMLDTGGEVIQAHGGGILYHEGNYYWYGENKDGPTLPAGGCGARVDALGVNAYKSRDLITWENLGTVLPAVTNDPTHDLHPSKIIERPKVLFNAATKSFVMWLHVDTADYKFARVAVAESAKPEGPFRYLGSFRPDSHESRDMTVFQDDDGSAWLIFSAENNSTLRIAPLSPDFRTLAGPSTRHFPGRFMEAPSIFKRAGKYYLIASGCTCWAPNAARSAVADSLTGPWTELGNPCFGPDAHVTFRGQGSFVFQIPGKKDAYLFMIDRWDTKDLGDSRYVWLPIEFRRDGSPRIEWRDRWDLSEFDQPRPAEPLLTPNTGIVETDTVTVSFSATAPGEVIRYTIDGTTPAPSSPIARGDAVIPSGREIRAVAFSGTRSSAEAVATYFKRIPAPPRPDVFLDTIDHVSGTTGFGSIQKGKNLDGDPLRLDGVEYPEGIAAHTNSTLTYALLPAWRRFVAIVGIDDNVGSRGSIQCEVRIDGKLHARTPILRGSETRLWNLDVAIPAGAKELSLVATDAGDGYGHDHTNWVQAGFIR